MDTQVKCEVPQDFLLGSILFLLYMTPSANIIRKHNFHYYADHPNFISLSINNLCKIQACVKDITPWMLCNCLLLSLDKTEVIIFEFDCQPR